MNRDKVNELLLLGTIKNNDESGILGYANQIYDERTKKSVQETVAAVQRQLEASESQSSSLKGDSANVANKIPDRLIKNTQEASSKYVDSTPVGEREGLKDAEYSFMSKLITLKRGQTISVNSTLGQDLRFYAAVDKDKTISEQTYVIYLGSGSKYKATSDVLVSYCAVPTDGAEATAGTAIQNSSYTILTESYDSRIRALEETANNLLETIKATKVDEAVKATNDGNGQEISKTYATIDALNGEVNRATAAEVSQADIEGNYLVLKNNAGVQIGNGVDISKFQVSDQFVDDVKLITEENKADLDNVKTDVLTPYILVTFRNTEVEDAKDKDPIRISIKDIWAVTNAGDLKLSDEYAKNTETGVALNVSAYDTVDSAIGKVEAKADNAQSTADEAKKAAEKRITEIYNDKNYFYLFGGDTVTTGVYANDDKAPTVIVFHAKGESTTLYDTVSVTGGNGFIDITQDTNSAVITTLTNSGESSIVVTNQSGETRQILLLVRQKELLGISKDNSGKVDKDTTYTKSGTDAKITEAINSLDSVAGETSVAAGKHVAMQVTQVDGKLNKDIVITENDIASAKALSDLTKTVSGNTETYTDSESPTIKGFVIDNNSNTLVAADAGQVTDIIRLKKGESISTNADNIIMYEVNASELTDGLPVVRVHDLDKAGDTYTATGDISVILFDNTGQNFRRDSGSTFAYTKTGTFNSIETRLKAIEAKAGTLVTKPSLQADKTDSNKITVTAGGQTSDSFTVPYATTAKSATSAGSAINATNDSNGNNIAETYATKSSMDTLSAKVDNKADTTSVYAKNEVYTKTETASLIANAITANLTAEDVNTSKTYDADAIEGVLQILS